MTPRDAAAIRALREPQPKAKYGNRNVPKMIRQVEALNAAIRSGDPEATEAAWDEVYQHIDFAYRVDATIAADALDEVTRLRAQADDAAAAIQDAIAQREAMREEIERLRDALEPFVTAWEIALRAAGEKPMSSSHLAAIAKHEIGSMAFFRARAALSPDRNGTNPATDGDK